MLQRAGWMVWVLLFGALGQAGCVSREERIQAELSQIVWQADYLHAVTGNFPSVWQDFWWALEAGDAGIGFQKPVMDPWGFPYVYRVVDGKPVAICYGRDRKRGGWEEDRDLGVTIETNGELAPGSDSISAFRPGRQIPYDFARDRPAPGAP